MTAVVVNFGYNRVARFVYTSKRRSSDLEGRYQESFNSFRPIGYQEANRIKQLELTFEKVGYGEDLDDLIEEMASPNRKFSRDLFLLLNPKFRDREPKRGEPYKTLTFKDRQAT